ncbi:MAG TPA: hypothetical protein VHE57_03110 [Mycobacteriales bacterium]|nr:hypothetical protein [Mycobacteriales bacterium]
MPSDELLSLIAANFEPVMAALDRIDLTEFPLEPDLDPARAPRPSDADSAQPS